MRRAATLSPSSAHRQFSPITTTYTRELDWLGTLRARVGYLWFPGLMFYGTGGLAYGENKLGAAAACPAWTPPCSSEAARPTKAPTRRRALR